MGSMHSRERESITPSIHHHYNPGGPPTQASQVQPGLMDLMIVLITPCQPSYISKQCTQYKTKSVFAFAMHTCKPITLHAFVQKLCKCLLSMPRVSSEHCNAAKHIDTLVLNTHLAGAADRAAPSRTGQDAMHWSPERPAGQDGAPPGLAAHTLCTCWPSRASQHGLQTRTSPSDQDKTIYGRSLYQIINKPGKPL